MEQQISCQSMAGSMQEDSSGWKIDAEYEMLPWQTWCVTVVKWQMGSYEQTAKCLSCTPGSLTLQNKCTTKLKKIELDKNLLCALFVALFQLLGEFVQRLLVTLSQTSFGRLVLNGDQLKVLLQLLHLVFTASTDLRLSQHTPFTCVTWVPCLHVVQTRCYSLEQRNVNCIFVHCLRLNFFLSFVLIL